MIEVVEGLFLCECASYGRLASLKGAVEEARRVVDRAGGLARLREDVERAESTAKEKRQRAREEAEVVTRPRPGA